MSLRACLRGGLACLPAVHVGRRTSGRSARGWELAYPAGRRGGGELGVDVTAQEFVPSRAVGGIGEKFRSSVATRSGGDPL